MIRNRFMKGWIR